jgi:DNA polymerase I-like protein with 3'-5' exonuclease and polymerase domains
MLGCPAQNPRKGCGLSALLLPVRDSVLLESPTELVEGTRRIVVDAMESTPAGFTVPLKVEVKSGRTWADGK